MKKQQYLKQQSIQLKDTRYALVAIKAVRQDDFNFELIVKDGTSRSSWFFHDAAMALDMFEKKCLELKGE